jgi:hypothetical protein
MGLVFFLKRVKGPELLPCANGISRRHASKYPFISKQNASNITRQRKAVTEYSESSKAIRINLFLTKWSKLVSTQLSKYILHAKSVTS